MEVFFFKRYGINLEPKQPTVHYGQMAGDLIQESTDFHFYLFPHTYLINVS